MRTARRFVPDADMAKIYTRTGDAGETGLFAGGRVRKDGARIEAIGDVDEANAVVGVVRMELLRGGAALAGMDDVLARVQHRLFDLGAELATPRPAEHGTNLVRDSDVAELEAEIDRYDAALEPLRTFVLPGGSAVAAQLHVARCICRRAERRIVALSVREPIRGEVLRYINRLSDLLFVLARAANQANRVPDVKWEPRSTGVPGADSL
jgi:cob(I)alamin adenosyltransferase